MKSSRMFSAIMVLVSSTILLAQPAMERKMPGDLNLTDTQKEQFEKISFDMQKKQIELRAKLETVKLEMNRLMNAELMDKTAIEKKMNEIADQTIALRMNQLNAWSEKNKLLNADQQKIWKKMMMKHIKSMQGNSDMMPHGMMGRGMRKEKMQRHSETDDDEQPRMQRRIEKEIIKK